MKKMFLVLLAFFIFIPVLAFAHQPWIVEGKNIRVVEPEISKAFYGQLKGEVDAYFISASEPFDLYVNILVPDVVGQKKDVSVIIFKGSEELTALNGSTFAWQKFFEPFGHDTYWQGPEYKVRAEAGEYEIRVLSEENDSKYSLAIGETETFGLRETINAFSTIPQLKRDFFAKLPIDFILSPLGWGLIIVMFILAFAFGLLYRLLLKRLAKNSPRGFHKNIGRPDRLFRLALSLGLLLLAITTTWNPLIIFFSGFTFFEAIFSWCGFYAALGKNTCPIN
ncbi:MAG: DUF2892 domain-containing protein [Candidatus Uhrbacteria bacterium]